MAENKLVRTVCDPNCHASPRCGISAHVENGRIVKIEPGSFPLPEYDRRICAMGMARLEQQYHPDRLRYPLKRAGARGEGKWQRTSWDEAFDFIAARLHVIAGQFGSRSLAFFSGSGASGVLTRGAAHRFAAAIGATAQRAGGVDYGVPKGLEYMFGVPASTYFKPGGHEFADAVNSRLILLWGGNPADTRLVDFHFILEAQRRGAKIVSIDPNRTATAEKADQWISPRPGTDAALALGLLHEILEQDRHDKQFLQRYTNAPYLVRADNQTLLRAADVNASAGAAYMVWDPSSQTVVSSDQVTSPALAGSYRLRLANGDSVECAPAFQLLRDLAASYPAERTAEITGVAAATIRELGREIGLYKPMSVRIGYGVDRWYYCDYTARAAANLVAATGNIGISGGGISVHDGSYAAPLNLRSFRSPDGHEAATLDVISLMQAIEHSRPYPIRALWLSGSNMFNQTSANRARVLRDIVPKLELLVVVDQFMTDSADLADMILPSCSIFEKNDLVAGMFLQLQRRAVEPEGESKADFDILAGLARRMGVAKHFAGAPEDYLREVLASDHVLLKGVSLERLQQEDAVLLNRSPKAYVAFADRKFKTASGRIEIYKEDLAQHGAELPYYREPIEASPDNPLCNRYPLILIFSHSRHRIHSSFANLEKIKQRDPGPVIAIHPADAERRGVVTNQLVRVHNQRGSAWLKCRLTPDVKPGVVVIAEGYWVKDFTRGDPYSLTHEQVSPTSENYAFYDTLVEVEPIEVGLA